MPSRKPKSLSRKQRARRKPDPRAEARRLVDAAYEQEDPEQRIALAQAALETWADCSEAYLLLSEQAMSAAEAIPFCESAVAAAARELGERKFDEMIGHFWSFLETRPYMQTRLSLAECLWEAGRLGEAIDHLQELLRLNPTDNQGCRQRLASALLRAGRRDDLRQLIAQFPNDFLIDLAYAQALLSFQEQGNTEESRAHLHRAHEQNRHVASMLVNGEPLPRELPEFISPGQESEAIHYLAEYRTVWRETEGAIPWVRATLQIALPKPPRRRSPAWSRVKPVLQQLPQSDAVWEVDLVALPSTSSTEKNSWAFLIADPTEARLLRLDLHDERPSDAELWQALLAVIRNPEGDEPARPRQIRFVRKTWHKNWGGKLSQVEVDCTLIERFVGIPEIADRLVQARRPGSDGDWQPPGNDVLEALPQQIGDVWLATVRPLPVQISIAGQMCRPTVQLVVDKTHDLVLASQLDDGEPPVDWLWRGLQSSMAEPHAGPPRRPGVVQVASDEEHATIAAPLESIGIRCVVDEDDQQIDAMLSELSDRLAGPQGNSLIRSPGVTAEQLEAFYSAAEEFYRRTPWHHLPGDSIIRVDIDQFESCPWYAVVVGQMGMQLGLALYEELELVQSLLAGQLSDAENARRTSALSLMFGEAFEVAAVDLEAIEQNGWPIASEEAYPAVMRINPGLALRVPLAWEIDLLTVCLGSLPAFAEARSTFAAQRVSIPDRGEFSVELSLLNE